jgi:hypothetical protein
MTLRNVVWPFFEREGHCASCGEEIAEEPDVLLCVACVSDARGAAKRDCTASAACVEIIDLN